MSRHVIAVLALFLPQLVWASLVEVTPMPYALKGMPPPSIRVDVNDHIVGYEIKLRRNDGKTVRTKGRGDPGTHRVIPLPQPVGAFHYEGELSVRDVNGVTASMPLSFDTEVYELKLEEHSRDLDARKVSVVFNRPAQKMQVKVRSETGKLIRDDEMVLNGTAPGTPIEIAWPKSQDQVLHVDVKVFDTNNFYTGIEFFPWSMSIPHEEVQFEFGKADVRDSERPKLDKSFAQIAEQVAKVGQFVALRLYVVGHTDTVGTAAQNRDLSLRRARSIGAYFRSRGLRIPVSYEGFGEDALLVSTPDETPEEKNRRAEYILSITDPEMKNAPSKPNWRKL